MREHVLITFATRRSYREVPDVPGGARYDPAKGYWLLGNEALVASDAFADGPVTKKCDHETGEDQKGE